MCGIIVKNKNKSYQNPDTFDIACDLLRPDSRGITVERGNDLRCRPNNVQYVAFYGQKMCVRYKILYDKSKEGGDEYDC